MNKKLYLYETSLVTSAGPQNEISESGGEGLEALNDAIQTYGGG